MKISVNKDNKLRILPEISLSWNKGVEGIDYKILWMYIGWIKSEIIIKFIGD